MPRLVEVVPFTRPAEALGRVRVTPLREWESCCESRSRCPIWPMSGSRFRSTFMSQCPTRIVPLRRHGVSGLEIEEMDRGAVDAQRERREQVDVVVCSGERRDR